MRVLSIAAVAGLLATSSYAGVVIPQVLKGDMTEASKKREFLPPLSNPQQYRQSFTIACGTNSDYPTFCEGSLFGGAVPASQLLQLDNVSCFLQSGEVNGVFIFTKPVINFRYAAAIGMIPSIPGPIYFFSGEKPTIFANGSGSDDLLNCYVSGTLWQAG